MDATFLGHYFYAYPNTEIAQCQGYAGLHLQLGSLAMGVLPARWKDRGGVSAFLGLLVPRGYKRRLFVGQFKLWPRGGPNGERARQQRARRTRDPNLGYSPPRAARANVIAGPSDTEREDGK